MMTSLVCRRTPSSALRHPVTSVLSVSSSPLLQMAHGGDFGKDFQSKPSLASRSPYQHSRLAAFQSFSTTGFSFYSTFSHFGHHTTQPRGIGSFSLDLSLARSFPSQPNTSKSQKRTFMPSLSSIPSDEEEAEKKRVGSLSPYEKEIELRHLDSEIARLQTLRGINTGELYTIRGKMKILARDYGVGFMVWYWTVWFTTAGLTYMAIEVGGVDPLAVASKVETFMGLESGYLSGRLDPTLGKIGLVVAVNECLEPLRLPIVVVTTKPVVNAFTKRY